jgi:hypothetical protein
MYSIKQKSLTPRERKKKSGKIKLLEFYLRLQKKNLFDKKKVLSRNKREREREIHAKKFTPMKSKSIS